MLKALRLGMAGIRAVDGTEVTTTRVQLTARPAVDASPPIACTLGAGELKGRLEEWERALEFVTGREAIDEGLRLSLVGDAPLGDIATLVAAEQGCCAFFRFAITIDPRGIALEVRAPAEAADIVSSLFGEAGEAAEASGWPGAEAPL
jgi:hypothetical protein